MNAYKAELLFRGILPKGVEQLPSGETQGILPKNAAISEDLGHTKRALIKVIRAKCLDCAHDPSEVRKCVSVSCPLWPYRMGKNPFHTRAKTANNPLSSNGRTADFESAN